VFQLDRFIVRGHQKVIEHFRWLSDTAKTEAERERFAKRLADECEALRRFAERQPHPPRQAA
jgi:hypothetical protein